MKTKHAIWILLFLSAIVFGTLYATRASYSPFFRSAFWAIGALGLVAPLTRLYIGLVYPETDVWMNPRRLFEMCMSLASSFATIKILCASKIVRQVGIYNLSQDVMFSVAFWIISFSICYTLLVGFSKETD